MKYEDMSREELISEIKRLSSLLKEEHKKIEDELCVHQIELEAQNIELKEKYKELEEARENYTELYDFAPSGYCTLDVRGIIKEINLTGAEILGKERSSLINFPFVSFISDCDRNRFFTYLEECLETEEKRKIELTLNKNDESSVHIELLTLTAMDKEQNKIYRTNFNDITEKKLSDEVILSERNRIKSILDTYPYGIYIVNKDYDIEYINPVIEGEFGHIMNRKCFEYFHNLKEPCKWCKNAEVFSGKTVRWEWSSKTGKIYDLFDMPVINSDGSTSKLEIFYDITERKKAEESLRKSEYKYRQLLEIATEGVWLIDIEGNTTLVNPKMAEMFGYTLDEMTGKHIFSFMDEPGVEKAKINLKHLEDGLKENYEFVFLKKDGTCLYTYISTTPVLDDNGNYAGGLALVTDITDRKHAEDALRKSEGKFFFAMETSHIGIWDLDLIDHGAFRSLEHDRIFGYSELLPYWSYEMFLEHVLPEDRPVVDKRFKKAVETASDWSFECRIKRIDGEIRWIWAAGRHNYDSAGMARRMSGIVQDITERKKSEEEKERLQAQLLHAHKMESVGRLAGGVAHDFNNILGIIITISESMMMDMEREDPLYERLQQIITSSERAANLVSQLLAFARKQTVSPEILDINETISSMIKMLHRLIGEDIQLVWTPGYNMGKVKIDPTQLNQILANLVINGRDAISGVGSIILETSSIVFDTSSISGYEEIPPGEYVMLSVSDTGTGISKETIKNIFEPFFTTKESGKGTGLGLSTVYGIVRQNRGFINVYSEEGKGTTFKIYLPAIKSEHIPSPSEKSSVRPAGGTETILVSEDEEDYLIPCKMVLEKLGYSVLTAKTPSEAIDIVEKYTGPVDLLITDVVMPEMSGRELMEKICKIRPAIKCLYMSGYTANIIAHHGVLDEGVNFIEKPFSIKAISGKVREVLDSK